MSHSKFLEQIADYYTAPGRFQQLADTTFILPNKRSAMFLKRYIQQRVTQPSALMPRFTTFARFASQTVRVAEAKRFEKLFMLYRAYQQALHEKDPGREEQVKDFDKFIFWGDMILDDFDEIDKALADPVKLYKNLRELKEISSDYLTDEQKDIIRRIWGETPFTQAVDSFWRHFNHGDESHLQHQFISLWQILARIYEIFRDKLRKARLSTPGMLMRDAMAKIKATPVEDLALRRYVFVDLAELTNAELAIMDRLQQAGTADFFWDMDSPLFENSNGQTNTDNRAFRMIARLKKKFPMPRDFSPEAVDTIGKIDIIGLPSAVGQAKSAGNVVRKWKAKGLLEGDQAIESAIVVPDPNLLTPLMLSLPNGIEKLNITMGLPYSSTSFATLFRAIISMQRRARKRKGNVHTYFFQDVLEILIHPHLQTLAPEKANAIRQYIFEQKLYNVDATKLMQNFPEISFIFKPIEDQDSLDETYAYVTGLISGIREALQKHMPTERVAASLEMKIMKYFDEEIAELKALIEKYDIRMVESTFLMLFEHILQSKILNVEGTPLEGLQVMGPLETRGLDFDNIIFLSMNERTFPRRDYVKTMIPNNLRRGYGLPPIEQSENFYSYYFFRAIARAKRITLLYDTRSPGKGAGEMSRYLAQLLYLKGSNDMSHSQLGLTSSMPTSREITVEKTEAVKKQLAKFTTEGSKTNVSASALKTYMKCPLSFYLQYVNDMKQDDEPVDYLDAAKMGTILHDASQRLYEMQGNQLITPQLLEHMAAHAPIDRILVEEVAMHMGLDPAKAREEDLSYEGKLIKAQLAIQLRSMLLAEKESYCANGGFKFDEAEKDVTKPWQITDKLKINFKMRIDRIDELSDDTIRIIDYKTGTDELKASKIQQLFNGDHSTNAIFQLLLYAEAYNDLEKSGKKIELSINKIRDIVLTGKITPITLSGQPLQPYPANSAEFRPLLNDLVEEIFLSDKPFTQCEDVRKCKFCPFLSLCGRTLPDTDF